MGCTNCRHNPTIDSTKSIKDIIKSKYKIEATLLGDGVFGKIFQASVIGQNNQKVAIKGMRQDRI